MPVFLHGAEFMIPSTPPMAKAAGNYLNSVLATQESNRNGYDESVMLDRDGNVSEASGENIFIVRNNKIYTPYIAGSALEGITRDAAIAIAKNLGYEVMERPISRTELYYGIGAVSHRDCSRNRSYNRYRWSRSR